MKKISTLFKVVKMKKNILFLFFILFLTIINAQNKLQLQKIYSENKPWTYERVNDHKNKFNFVVVTDRTGGERKGIWEKGIEKINLMQPAFVVSVGDLINGYTEDLNKIENEWNEFNSFVKKLEMPFFYVAGNHDYTNEVMENEWFKRFGTDYYHFLYKNVLFICLNSEHGYTALKNPDLGNDQVKYVEKILKKNANVKWTMIFMHQPLWLRESGKNWLKVENLLKERKHSVFTGHHHNYRLYERNKNDYFVLATMGGGSKLRGNKYGEFDHFMFITMTENGPYFSNLMLDGIEGKNIRKVNNN
jgi:predicted phosphodiesterase